MLTAGRQERMQGSWEALKFLLALLETAEPQNSEKSNKKTLKWMDHAEIEENPAFPKATDGF